MAQTLEAIKGGGGSIRVGTVGTIGSLMTRELESSSSSYQPSSSRHSSPSVPTHASRGDYNPKARRSLDEASSSSAKTSMKQRSPEISESGRSKNRQRVQVLGAITAKRQKQKASFDEERISKRSPELSRITRTHIRSHQIPMLGSENITLDKTPTRTKPTKKGSNIVDIVDVNCGDPTVKLTSGLKKLGFSKLSQSII